MRDHISSVKDEKRVELHLTNRKCSLSLFNNDYNTGNIFKEM